ncbi:Mannitol-1-phosphate 5-dehydrogenase [Brachybacterium faecium]|uniref:Mannitol-1-phosphate 5-dehydrogenase n=1 Tax=Brachybacterium faecium (strain ATCC 43885 / DSM 4810 / JCM 11609 / LMG 19847 / NBRC 14762 / NCIMB 9860 / 6-10) TaxID=446465 RepID=C7M9L9_BRAFD|nr:mannitol-1-phosphate 5-dehydrogenase [Brachybacterium faecium]ACU84563.1 D-mannitol 1-phosphate 5-dehydrogenase [Brachybacterium faecium DSM 4810]SLN01676.1 Mannitol-1-phosphate 5-dehydrogenase [Brachybacterium faecium]HJG52735.1 mannitol-1-phosphate 5-dehydrogenase [Brachybacterium faecium]
MKAVHFGAGNIGRGFVGLLLHEAGYEVVFSDVAAPLVEQLQQAESYTVSTVGQRPATTVVDGFRALNSAQDPEGLSEEIASADLVTTAVGAGILRFVAPGIAAGIAARPSGAPPLAVLACENAINATDLLEQEIRTNYQGDDLEEKAVFANTAVDRIVPVQAEGAGLDVTVEDFYEWAVERGPFDGHEPDIPGITWVEDLEPYIERKLFTVNTGHATTAWHGWEAGHATIAEAIRDPAVAVEVESVLGETSALLSAKHGFGADEMASYRTKVLGRFANEALPDPVDRVGRAPLRKLSRHDRIIGPAAELAERDLPYEGLLAAFAAALAFAPAEDDEAQRLQELLRSADPDAATVEITGLEPGHPLYAEVRALVAARSRA